MNTATTSLHLLHYHVINTTSRPLARKELWTLQLFFVYNLQEVFIFHGLLEVVKYQYSVKALVKPEYSHGISHLYEMRISLLHR